jgi:DNA-binding IclR family transcriptional regulator
MRVLQIVVNMKSAGTLTEIAELSQLAPSRVYRYLASFVHGGFVTQDAATSRYDLGPSLLELGFAALSRIDAIQLACDVMKELTQKLDLASALSVWGTNGPSIIRTERGHLELAVQSYEGLNLAVPITAAGRIFLTYMEETQTRSILERDLKAWNSAVPAKQRLSANDLIRVCRDVRERGFASTTGLRTPNIATLAAPVFNQSGAVSMAISIFGILGSVDVSPKGMPVKELKAGAERISRMIGWRGPTA